MYWDLKKWLTLMTLLTNFDIIDNVDNVGNVDNIYNVDIIVTVDIVERTGSRHLSHSCQNVVGEGSIHLKQSKLASTRVEQDPPGWRCLMPVRRQMPSAPNLEAG